jgi:predicted metal-dependent hydrolase
LTFHWHIIKAPHHIVGYVVGHELFHLMPPNHSRKFCSLVARDDASNEDHRAWLIERGAMLP